MSIVTRAAGAVRSAIGAVSNPLKPNAGLRNSFGTRDYGTYNIEARNAYMTMSSVFGCVGAYALNDPQIKLKVQRLDGTPWEDHPVQWLIRHPNDDMGEREVRLFNCIYKPLGGASHQYLYRSKSTDQIIGWRPLSTSELAPVPVTDRPIGRESWVDYFWHTPLNQAPERVETRNVISLRFPSINPLTPQLFLSPLAAAFKDVEADKEITQLPLDLMKNSSFITWVFALGTGAGEMDDADYEAAKSDILAATTGKNKFDPMVVRAGGSASYQGVEFAKMEFSKLGQRPEVRICVALHVPIRYAGFSAGIDASTSDNYVASWLAFVKNSVLGQAILDADVLTNALTRESWQNHPLAVLYGLDRAATSEFRIVVDTSDVQALKTEMMSLHDNARKNFAAGVTTMDETRAELGKPALGAANGGDEFGKGSSESATPTDRTTNVMDTPKPKE